VEFLGLNYPLKDKMNDLIANYKNSSVLDLTGAIFEYDLNYFFLNGEKIVQGKRTGQFSKFNNLGKAITQSNIKTNDFSSGPMDPNVCYELYWSTYENGVMTSATFIGYSDGCYGATGGSVSGYDSASAYQGGGGPYSGNDAPPPIITNNVQDTCLKNMVNAAINRNIQYNLKESMNGIFGGKQTNFNLDFIDGPLATQTDGVTDVLNSTGNYNTTEQRYTELLSMSVRITLNSSTLPGGSEEFTTATILHEALHAYFRLTNTSFDHEVMVSKYIPWFTSALKSIYPIITDYDATALAYGGLTQTAGALMGNQSAMLNDYLITNGDYKTAKSGTACH